MGSAAATTARWKTVAAQAALTFMAAWIGAEAVLWTLDSLRRPQTGGAETDDFDPRYPAPYVMFHAQPNRSVHYEQEQGRNGELSYAQVNSRGFRHADEIELLKPPDERRIFVLGGSALFNGLRNETTITGYLERLLNESSDGTVFQVINASIVSGDSDQELAVLVHQVVDLSPDVVLVVDGFNDVWTRLYYEPRIGHPLNWTSFENAHRNNRMLRASLDALNPLDHLLAMSKVATRLNPSWKLENRIIRSFREAAGAPESSVEVSDELVHKAAVRLVVNWLKMYRIAKANGARMMAVLQPINPTAAASRPVSLYYELVEKQIELLRPQGFPFFSLAHALDDRRELFRDVVHTWDDAHPVYARLIRDLLVAEGILDA